MASRIIYFCSPKEDLSAGAETWVLRDFQTIRTIRTIRTNSREPDLRLETTGA